MNYNPETHVVVPKEPTDGFSAWVEANLPSGTVIADPQWWVTRLHRAVIAAAPQPQQSAEPIMALFQHDETGRFTSVEPQLKDDFAAMNKRWNFVSMLFTAPPKLADIQAKAIEAAAKECDRQALYNHENWPDDPSSRSTATECADALRELAEKVLKGEVKL